MSSNQPTNLYPLPAPAEPTSAGSDASTTEDLRLAQERKEQFRLVRIQSYNWGTFDGILRVDVSEKGMLFIGPSGSGKSTIFDAHAALMTPPRLLHYNVAARESETKQDRTTLTYVRGVWGEQTAGTGEIAQQQLRPGPTWAVISEVYRNGLGDVVTLAHVYWVKGSSNQTRDVHRRFVVASRLLDLSELDFFPESQFNVRRFKSDLPGVWESDSFSEYQERMRSRLGIDAENALKLLHKTQSAKNLGSLTDFLRDFMLDEPKTHAMADHLVEQFERLENAHNEVVSAAKQIATLTPARVQNADREAKISQRSELSEARTGIEHVEREMLRDLRLTRIAALETRLSGLQSLLLIKQQDSVDAQGSVTTLQRQRDGLGGEQLATLDASRAAAEQDASEKQVRFNQIATACRHLGLTMPGDPLKHAELVTQGRRELDNAAGGGPEGSTHRDELVVAQHEGKKELDQIQRNLVALTRLPRSKMPPELTDIRRHICSEIKVDEGALPFAGELIEMDPAEKGWQGAVERVLKGFAKTLLVPEELYGPVSRIVNSTNLRGRLVYLRLIPHNGRSPAPQTNGLFEKVQVSEGRFQSWVERELLQGFDAVCVETVEDLQDVSFGVTRAGLMKYNGRRHEKDDRFAVNDQRHWVLGADTRSKAAALQDSHDELERRIAGIESELQKIDTKERARIGRMLHWQTLVDRTWEEIDHQSAALRATRLKGEMDALRAASPDLDILERKISEAVIAAKKAAERLDTHKDTISGVKFDLGNHQNALASADALAPVAPTPLQRHAVQQRLDELGLTPTIESISKDINQVDRKIGSEIGALDSAIAQLVNKIEKQFSEYNRVWEAESGGLDPTMASFEEYDAKLTRLEVDDLPRFEVRFKELLNEQSNQHIALLSNQLEQERRDISDRMDTVNESLARAEYNKGTHLLIEVEEHTPSEAVELKAQLRAALSHSLSMDDAEAEARFQTMKKLIRRLASQEPQQVAWRKLALDVRLHVEFIARELDEEDREVQVHRSGAGKSGGQRQKLTATCLAAALRYQLGGSGRTLPSYSTIFLDEAFDKADADFTDAAMKIFKSFGFQLIVATPIKSVMTIEPYVGGAVFIHIKDRKHSRALVLRYDDETQKIDFRPIDGTSANDEAS
ncbi:ATP-binding protein [Roseateles noduli]|uniref:ATP-binding protein n=1 Tax=Roseateles noduli TaxID=2052484 RepID=UPI003D645CC3